MAKSELNDIMKMIEGLSPEAQAAIIEALVQEEPKKKVRRKHYKKEQQAKQPEPPAEPPKQRRKRPFVNEFERSPLFNAHQEDNSIDKKLWSGHQPTERDRPPASYVNVNCAGCGKSQKVLSSHIYKSGRGPDETSSYYCNTCVTKRK